MREHKSFWNRGRKKKASKLKLSFAEVSTLASIVEKEAGNEQDKKKMGGLYNKIPLTYITMLIGSLSLIGLPFLSGYKQIYHTVVIISDFH